MKRKKLLTLFGSICLILVLVALLIPACAPEKVPVAPTPVAPTPVAPTPTPTLPEIMIVTAYDVGTSGYTFTVGLAEAMYKQTGIKLRVIPSGTDVGRVIPVRMGDAHIGMTSAGTVYPLSYGIYDFCSYEWGPQPVRMAWSSLLAAAGMMVRDDSGIETLADLKGKRVPWVPGGTAVNLVNSAHLAFAGLTWDDVIRVEMSSYGVAITSVKDGTSDVCYTDATSSLAYALESSPHGIGWLPVLRDDDEGWARMKEVAPYVVPRHSIVGAGISEEEPVDLAVYSYPVFWVYPDQDEEIVYTFTKFLVEGYDSYKDTHPCMPGWTLDVALDCLGLPWPYNEGAIRYFKETGKWTANHDKWNNEQLDRYSALEKAWQKFRESSLNEGVKDKDLPSLWEEELKEKLGIEVYPVR